MKVVEKTGSSLDGNTLRYIADDLWHELNGIESHYPEILDDADYLRIKAEFIQGSHNSSYQQDLERLYGELIECLGRISTQSANVISLTARRERAKSLADYLPKGFQDFINKITESKLQSEYYENAYQGTAEALFMNELEDGINSVVPRHREAVKDRIYEILLENADEEDATAIDKADMDTILALMGIRDEFDLLAAAIDQGHQKIAEVILFIREEIDKEYADTDTAELRLGKANREEFETLESGIRKLISAIAQHEPRYGNVKELSRAQRLEFARRIIMPSLKTVKDKRPSISDAVRLGLTTEEIKVLLLSGFLKPPGTEEALEFADDTSMDPDSGRTIAEIEAGALRRRPIGKIVPIPGRPRRTDN